MSAYKIALLKLAAYYEKALTDEQIRIYSEQLSQSLTELEVAQSISMYVDNPENEFFPRPVSKLIALIKRPIAKDDQAQNLADLLRMAISKHGQHWEDGHFMGGERVYAGRTCSYPHWSWAAVSEFGGVGLEIVKRNGGWMNFCNSYFTQPEGVFKKQLRDAASTVIELSEKGLLQDPQLITATPINGLLSGIIKSIPGSEK